MKACVGTTGAVFAVDAGDAARAAFGNPQFALVPGFVVVTLLSAGLAVRSRRASRALP